MTELKATDLRAWTEADLRARVTELEEEQFRLRFRSATETLEEPLRLRGIRKDIARLHTVISEKRRAAAGAGATAGARPDGRGAAKRAQRGRNAK
jgi:large subunit ribosomal protein L29